MQTPKIANLPANRLKDGRQHVADRDPSVTKNRTYSDTEEPNEKTGVHA